MTSLISTEKSSTSFPYLSQWKAANWNDYITYRNTVEDQRIKLYYYKNKLLIQMGKEGINHTSINDLFTMILFSWFSQHPEITMNSFGGVLLEKKEKRSASPDLGVYLGENYPKWKPEESRYINLEKWAVPNLVGEISDTTLSIDLDEKKHLYAELGIPEYWVIDVQGKRVFCFQLQEDGNYQKSELSSVLKGLPIPLLVETMQRLEQETNSSAANWFSQEILKLKTTDE
ncbi:MAG: Uma2 family endonuclease [Crocosphaera sp.]|nr:Uma2 family endonuclease [Crocosphaera sp.]